jgi:putative glutamine amidotransferase
VRAAFQRDAPLLAICRGAQVLTVALGGSLFTDVPTDLPSIAHPYQEGSALDTVAHEVTVDRDSVLHRVVGADRIAVNSAHHQAIRDVPSQLRIAARSEDGLIEAVEVRARRFIVGVQWHPERRAHVDPLSARLFQALILAAQGS